VIAQSGVRNWRRQLRVKGRPQAAKFWCLTFPSIADIHRHSNRTNPSDHAAAACLAHNPSRPMPVGVSLTVRKNSKKLRFDLPGRPYFTRRFSAASLPLFETMSNVTLAPSRKSLSPALSTAEM